jgi:hypothetical protein
MQNDRTRLEDTRFVILKLIPIFTVTGKVETQHNIYTGEILKFKVKKKNLRISKHNFNLGTARKISCVKLLKVNNG